MVERKKPKFVVIVPGISPMDEHWSTIPQFPGAIAILHSISPQPNGTRMANFILSSTTILGSIQIEFAEASEMEIDTQEIRQFIEEHERN